MKHQLIILVMLALGLNINTLFHEYALDDIVVLTENSFVQKGINGIPEILTADYIKGYSTKENVLTGARYRPLSLIIFALEYQFFGANPFVSHLINIILFAILTILLFQLLHKYIFHNQNNNLAFLTCILFTIHPIHTEVIANVKSRDELITFILLIASLIFLIKYIEKINQRFFFVSLVFFFLALLTKESAVTYIGILPLVLYFFYNQSLRKSIIAVIPFILLFAVWLLIRYFTVGFNYYPVTDVTNSPYLYATLSEAFATKIFIVYKYLQLLVFPYPLSTDYGYNQIPYIDINSIKFIMPFIFLLALIIIAIYTFKKRSIFSFCILFYLITISTGTNFIIDLGTPLAERMLFQASLAFCIGAAVFFLWIYTLSKEISLILFIILFTTFSIKTIARNRDWKNNETLFLADVISSPNSARMNLYACEIYIIKANKEKEENQRIEFLQKAVYYGEKSMKIHSKFNYTYLRLGFAYYHLHNYFKAADLWIYALQLESNDAETIKWSHHLSDVLYKQGNGYSDQQNIQDAIKCYQKSVELNYNNVEAWYNLGENYFLIHDSIHADKAWEVVKKLDPQHSFIKDQY